MGIWTIINSDYYGTNVGDYAFTAVKGWHTCEVPVGEYCPDLAYGARRATKFVWTDC